MFVLKVRRAFIPRAPGRSHQLGGNRKLPTFAVCPACACIFGPLARRTQVYCSMACKASAQATGRMVRHRPTAEARRAQGLVRYYTGTGLLTRPKVCEHCGAPGRIEAAHYDYTEPLNVRWLCVSCHRRWDKQRPKNGTVRLPAIPKAERIAARENAPVATEASVEGE